MENIMEDMENPLDDFFLDKEFLRKYAVETGCDPLPSTHFYQNIECDGW